MYVCTYVRMYVCTYVRMYVCTYVRMYVRMYVCTPGVCMSVLMLGATPQSVETFPVQSDVSSMF